MSRHHPIIAVTGSSGAGTSNVRRAFEHIFSRAKIRPAMVVGDCFHRYDRSRMYQRVEEAEGRGERLTHFGPEGNHFDLLEDLFREYSERGTGRKRHYIHDEKEADQYGHPPGTLTPWEPIEEDSELLFYEGLHGGLITDKVNVAQYVDLLIGVVPIINLEWIQKIHRDRNIRGASQENAVRMILSRMHDYVHCITPQFSRTHINFQRVPTVDTSNPFASRNIPSESESFTVIHIQDRTRIPVDFRELLEMLGDAFMSSPDSLVVPAGKMVFAMQLLLTPIIQGLLQARRAEAPAKPKS